MKNKKKIIILIISLCLILFILSIFSTGTYSKFFGKILGESKTEIAEPVFVLENTDKKIVDNSNQEVDYYFKNAETSKYMQPDDNGDLHMEQHEFDLCEACYDKMIQAFTIPVDRKIENELL